MSRRLLSLLPLAMLAAVTLSALSSCASNDLSSQVLQAHIGIVSVMPRADSAGVSVNAPGVVSFVDDLDSREAAVLSFTLTDAAGNVVAGTVDLLSNAATFTPAAPLAPNTAHRFSITTGVRLVRGKLVRDVYEWNFATGSAAATQR
ncbi:MAG: Ig-like domain-containing protein [Candidatus Eisenbacteria bacterium]|nr:Ig-like domain-containing protein [Candidatus Eisenbacteria bacterium]